jgi:hypothetical protein
MSRLIQIFLSTPSDVAEEQFELKALVAEIDDVAAFLAPERDVRIKVIHYATDVYPDVGGPQQVVDRRSSSD